MQCRCSTAAHFPAKTCRQEAAQAGAAHLKQSLSGGLPGVGAASSRILSGLPGGADGGTNPLLQGLEAGTDVGTDHTLHQLNAPAVGQAG